MNVSFKDGVYKLYFWSPFLQSNKTNPRRLLSGVYCWFWCLSSNLVEVVGNNGWKSCCGIPNSVCDLKFRRMNCQLLNVMLSNIEKKTLATFIATFVTYNGDAIRVVFRSLNSFLQESNSLQKLLLERGWLTGNEIV